MYINSVSNPCYSSFIIGLNTFFPEFIYVYLDQFTHKQIKVQRNFFVQAFFLQAFFVQAFFFIGIYFFISYLTIIVDY